jgi:hypothetical protein
MKTQHVSLVTIIVLVLIVTSSTYVIFNPVVHRHYMIVGYVRPNSTDHNVSQNVTATTIRVINDINTTIAYAPKTIL